MIVMFSVEHIACGFDILVTGTQFGVPRLPFCRWSFCGDHRRRLPQARRDSEEDALAESHWATTVSEVKVPMGQLPELPLEVAARKTLKQSLEQASPGCLVVLPVALNTHGGLGHFASSWCTVPHQCKD